MNHSQTNPKHPIDLVGRLKGPVLGLYGSADSSIPVERLEKMRRALKKAGKKAEIIVYPDVPHAFTADYLSPFVS